MGHPLRCRCGALTGVVTHGERATHSICYCKDCQAFARFLGREADILDARGGSEGVQTLPRHVRLLTGAQHLACMRLSEKGMLRWYAACCRTPIGNTPPTGKLPFVGLARSCLESSAPTVEQSFGPIRFCAYVSGARGEPRPKPFGVAGLILWILRNTTLARLKRDFGGNPFFDIAKDSPVVPPTVLTASERDRLRQAA